MILDDGGDATLLVHLGVQAEKDGKAPTLASAQSAEQRVIYQVLNESLAQDSNRWTTTVGNAIKGVTEETTTGVLRLYDMMREGRSSSRPSTSTTRSPRASSTTSTAAGTR